MAACVPMPPQPSGPPAAPTMVQLEIPTTTFGAGFTSITPAVRPTDTIPANYFVLPLLTTTSPIVRVLFRSPYPSDLAVTARDVSRGQSVTLPQLPNGSAMPSTGAFQVVSVTPNNPATWLIVVRYPNSFQGSKLITTAISDIVGGVASAPLPFSMSFEGSTVTVSIATENNDGKVTSNPPGIDCPGTCSAEFLTTSSVVLTQSVLRNQTEFTGWTGSCTGTGNTCMVALGAPGALPRIPVNPVVTANFRNHTRTPIPPVTALCPVPMITGMLRVAQPNCGLAARDGASSTCDVQGWFCCGASGGNASARCSGHNETAATCQTDPLSGTGPTNQLLIQPGGCYVSAP